MPDLLTTDQIGQQTASLHNDWEIDSAQQSISRTFKLANFLEAMAFANSVAWIAEQQDHHPDLTIGYGKCRVSYTTHSAGGLTTLDITGAQSVDRLLKP